MKYVQLESVIVKDHVICIFIIFNVVVRLFYTIFRKGLYECLKNFISFYDTYIHSYRDYVGQSTPYH